MSKAKELIKLCEGVVRVSFRGANRGQRLDSLPGAYDGNEPDPEVKRKQVTHKDKAVKAPSVQLLDKQVKVDKIPSSKYDQRSIDAFNVWFKKARAMVHDHYLKDYRANEHGGQFSTLGYDIGKKFLRIWRAHMWWNGKDFTKPDQKSAYCFIDLETGNVYKPAGWKGPTKNIVRGNIFDPDRMGVTAYGAHTY